MLDLSKLVRVETLLEELRSYSDNRSNCHSELEEKYYLFWKDGLSKHKQQIYTLDIVPQEFIMYFSSNAANAFVELSKKYFPKLDLAKSSPANPGFYFGQLIQVNSVDLQYYLSFSQKVLQDVDAVFHSGLGSRIKTQLDDKTLKEYFMDSYDNLFKENNFIVLNHSNLDEGGLLHFLSLLAENKLPDYVKRQPAGMEQVVHYIKKEIDFSKIDPTDIELDEECIEEQINDDQKQDDKTDIGPRS